MRHQSTRPYDSEDQVSAPVHLGFFISGAIILWSIFVAISLIWNLMVEKSGTIETAKIEARATLEKDKIYRRWNASHGGIYVLVTEATQSNRYLTRTERDIQTPSGRKLTKINPAYMTRQVHEMEMETNGVKGHITSLNPIRPENAPDIWEKYALEAFQKGKTEISSVEQIEGNSYMRLMGSLVTEKGCLVCHAKQGYKLGDIRGGISVSVPLAPLLAIERIHVRTLYLWHGLLWLVGLTGIFFASYIFKKQINRRIKIEEKLRQHEKMQGVLEMAGAVCHELNQPLQNISLCSELLMTDLEKNNNISIELKKIKGQVDRMGKITKKLQLISKYKTKKYLKRKIIDIDEATS